MDPLWAHNEIAAVTGAARSEEGAVFGVSIDTRTLQTGDLFVALAGDKQDGHDFVTQAFKAGASAALVSRINPDGVEPGTLIQVEDPMTALTDLAVARRASSSAKIVGVTGSVGKTSTKDALAAALSRTGKTHASERSYNNAIGVPLTMARMPVDTEFAIFEMGMNHADELRHLANLVRPDVAVVTTVELVHAEHFESLEAIADAKAEIFEGVVPGGIAILNADNPMTPRLADAAKECGIGTQIYFGESRTADIRLLKSHLADDCSTVTADIAGQIMTYKIGIPGAHWIMNSLAILASVYSLEADLGQAGLVLAALTALKGRGRRHRIDYLDGSILIIDESYNASPVSMRAAIAELGRTVPLQPRAGQSGRKLVVLGDMLELGAAAEAEHAALAEALDEAQIDQVFTVGSATQALVDKLPSFRKADHRETVAEIVPLLRKSLIPGDAVMIKGSNSIGLSAVVDELLALAEAPSTNHQAWG